MNFSPSPHPIDMQPPSPPSPPSSPKTKQRKPFVFPEDALGDDEHIPHIKTLDDEGKGSAKSDKSQDTDGQDKSSAPKKPRHRHSPAQLAALNELFDKNDHPSLDDRSELAEKLGMETKTVNAWFQNKRASTKKRNKGTAPASSNDPASNASPSDAPSQKGAKGSSSTSPSIPNLLNSPHTPGRSSGSHTRQTHSRSHPSSSSSSRRSRQKVLQLDGPLTDRSSASSKSASRGEGALQSSFFAGPPEFFSSQDRFVSENRFPEPEGGPPFAPKGEIEGARFLSETDSRFVSENDGASDGAPPRKARGEPIRMRTSPEQAEELRRAYAVNDHPTREEREELADKIGMRYQSVTNWFQNQRSQAKKNKDESPAFTPSSSVAPDSSNSTGFSTGTRLPTPEEDPRPQRTYSGFPPGAQHPSLPPISSGRPPLPPLLPQIHLSPRPDVDPYATVKAMATPRNRLSLPPSLHPRTTSPRTRRSVTPYAREIRNIGNGNAPDGNTVQGGGEEGSARPRRSRPEPYQLDALKKLLQHTATPSIEERSAVALEVGMDIGKVTNWFRNIRQTARKRAKRAGGARLRGRGGQSNGYERAGSSDSSSPYEDEGDAMDLDFGDDMDMDERSEDEYQEAVTPSPGLSPSPPPAKRFRSHIPLPMARSDGSMGVESMGVGLIEPAAFSELEKAVGMSNVRPASDVSLSVSGVGGVTYSGVRIEDALLLLSFHQHAVH
ncbi:hypothetical protein BV22DRAFT_1111180 [Leucogyrophana mollusca]|uniref:Uncharacterized protein n=1 Tax=Leucogyrophana mollusca TaxID=85980 RepID=A0ACB8BPH0_9AGAM|nr:hypothetical protein BV22DRAFT_1111180 [Leucogyrophana mollusca]